MQGREEERRHAVEEGVNFEYLTTPIGFIGDEDRRRRGVELHPHGARRARRLRPPPPEPDRGLELHDPRLALWSSPSATTPTRSSWRHAAVEADRWNLVRVDPRTHQTNVPYIFAGGDIVNGADLVVTAIADAKRAATWINQYLSTLGEMPAG